MNKTAKLKASKQVLIVLSTLPLIWLLFYISYGYTVLYENFNRTYADIIGLVTGFAGVALCVAILVIFKSTKAVKSLSVLGLISAVMLILIMIFNMSFLSGYVSN